VRERRSFPYNEKKKKNATRQSLSPQGEGEGVTVGGRERIWAFSDTMRKRKEERRGENSMGKKGREKKRGKGRYL